MRLQLHRDFDFARFPVKRNANPEAKSIRVFRVTGRSLFNNMVVLSRAFWVQDGCDREIYFTYQILNGHKKRVSEANIDRRVYDCWC